MPATSASPVASLPLAAAIAAANAPSVSTATTTSDLEGTQLYPVLAILEPTQSTLSSATTASSSVHLPNPLLSASSIAGLVIPSLQASLAAGDAHDVILITRDDLENGAPKKKGGAAKDAGAASAAAAAAKKKGKAEEVSEEEAGLYSLSEALVEVLRDRIESDLSIARDALIEKRRAEQEAANPDLHFDGKKGAKGAKKGAVAPSKVAASPANKSNSNKKTSGNGSGSARGSARSTSRPQSPSHGASAAEPAPVVTFTYPTRQPLHFILYDVVRTVGDVARVQEILQLAVDVYLKLQDDTAPSSAASAAAYELEFKEFLYGSPSRSNPNDPTEVRLEREAKEDAVARAAIPHAHPLDRNVYGSKQVVAQPSMIGASPLLLALVDANQKESKFRNLVFLPVMLPQPTAAPTLGMSINIPTSAASPPPSARGARDSIKLDKNASATGGSVAAASSASASKDKKKKGAVEAPVVPTAEQELIARLNQEIILAVREFSSARDDFAQWSSSASVVTLPVAPAAASTTDTRLYNHLLNQLPPATVGIEHMLYSMFEQIAVHSSSSSSGSASASGNGGSSKMDLNEFFAGETLDEVEAFMSAALDRVTFASPAPPLLTSPQQNRWNDKSKSSTSVLSADNTHGGAKLGSAVESSSPFLKYGDDFAVRRIEAALTLGLPLVPDSTSLAAEALLSEFLPIPGVNGKGMPSVSTEEQERQSMDNTQLFQRATSGEGTGAPMDPAVFERALLLLELEEMLLNPTPDWKFTHQAALDPTQQTEVDVHIHALPASAASSTSTAGSSTLPATKSLKVKEKRSGASLFHTAHARLASQTVEAAVAARLRELHEEAKKNNSGLGFGPGFGLKDQSDAAEDQWQWNLEERGYQEEFDARTLPQKLLSAMTSFSGTSNTTVRYRAMFDELLVTVHSSTPLVRQRTYEWQDYLTPNLTLQGWLESNPAVQKLRPAVLHNFVDKAYSGKLAEKSTVYFPLEQGRVGVHLLQSGEQATSYVFLEKDGTFITMQKLLVEDGPAVAAPVATVEEIKDIPAVAVEEAREVESAQSDRSSTSAGGTRRVSSAKKKDAPAVAAAKSATTTAAPPAKPSSASKTVLSPSAKKKQQQQEAKEAEEKAQAEREAAEAAALKEAEEKAAAEKALRDSIPRIPLESILFNARFPDSTRFSASGRRNDGSNRVTYTTHAGLIVEIRGQNDEVYLKYPRSVIDGGKEQPLIPFKKHLVSDLEVSEQAAQVLNAQAQASGVVSTGNNASILAANEDFRVVSPEGIIYRVQLDGSAFLLLPNGHVGFRANAAAAWIWTDNLGERTQKQQDGSIVQLSSVQVAKQYDAESGATVVTRADLSMFISYADGSSLAQHAEGSRIYTDVISYDEKADSLSNSTGVSDSKLRKKVVVETPRFPSLAFTHSLRTDLRDAAESFATAASGPLSSGIERRNVVDVAIEFEPEGASLRKHSATDAVVLSRRAAETFIVHPTGHVLFVGVDFDRDSLAEGFEQGLVDFNALPKHVYDFDLNYVSAGRVSLNDAEDNIFRLSCAGISEMILGRERNLMQQGQQDSIPASYYPLPSHALQPRVFIVRKDGTGFEILRSETVQQFLKQAEKDPHTKLLPIENASSEDSQSKSLKFLTSIKPQQSYRRHPVIPNVVRAAPSALAAGSSLAALSSTDPLVVLHGSKIASSPISAPPSLVYRLLVPTPHVTHDDKAAAWQERKAWNDWKELQESQEVEYRMDIVRGERSEDEIREAERVEAEVRRAREGLLSRQAAHSSLLEEHEADARGAPVNGRVSARSSRPSTANAHRQPSSSTLLPRPLHEEEEGEAVVQKMVQTLTAPPKTFFKNKGSEPVAKEKKSSSSSRPTSASQRAAQVTAEAAQSFFSHPSFRRDYLLASLLQRLTDLSSPFIQGSRARESGEDEQSAAEKEELWATLDDAQRQAYQEQFDSQLTHLVSTCMQFIAQASLFLSKPYDASFRELQLQKEPYLSLLEQGSPHFRVVVEQLASVLGFSKENEKLVLTTRDDIAFRENVELVKSKLLELTNSGSKSISSPRASSSSSSSAAAAEEKEEPVRAGSAAEAEGDYVDYEAVVANLTAKERLAFQSTPAYQQYLARESRLKSIKSTYSTQHHASHGASFQFTSPFAPREPYYPPQPPRTAVPANSNPTVTDVTGAARKRENKVQLPAAMAPSAPAELNEKYLMNELQSGQPRPSAKTSSTVKQTWHTSTAPFANFVLHPAALDLGPVRKGCTYRATLSLTNAGNMTGRFNVIQPSERNDLLHLRVLYRPGLVAPGLQRRLEVELYAGTVGDLTDEIVIKTEQHIFRLPISARILNDADFAKVTAGGVGAANPLSATSFTVPAVHDPTRNVSYDQAFPTSPQGKGKAGPFHLTSTFSQPTKAGPAFSKNSSLPSTVPRTHFGQTGELRLVNAGPTPHAMQTIQKQQQALDRTQQARSQGDDDKSEI